jgi:hypothetical protein
MFTGLYPAPAADSTLIRGFGFAAVPDSPDSGGKSVAGPVSARRHPASCRAIHPLVYCPPMPDKILVWVGASFEDLLDFPPEARRTAGYELRRIQRGLMPTDWKPMPSVGQGVNEIRIHTDGRT